ncbi:MAG: zinc ABC transporter ATP-binding protein ZnuC [Paracoccus denitrificans]|nr:MAG: zinc ABC transporter ATP-binding protein ZnuC [Paracoccus denitrificans]PZO83391.1 MAG: zinc ABC transporter ATP-binding protein ZnuC [Paracoccus denitrificans]
MNALTKAPLIEARGLTVTRPGMDGAVIEDVDLMISPGEIVTIVGPNGSGKSTLIRALMGHLPLAGGRVDRIKGLRIGYVPQRVQMDAAMPMTVRRFMSLPRRVSDAVAAAALARTGVDGLQDRQIARLSGGQFQRVLLARALIGGPQILVLDEPTQGLDQPGSVAFYDLIESVCRETHAAVLLVSHDLLVVMRASDRVVCLNGHVCCQGTPEDVSIAPAYRALFGAGDRTLALYRHHHDHSHDTAVDAAGHDHSHDAHDGKHCTHA